MAALHNGYKDEALVDDLAMKPPSDYADLQDQFAGFVRREEARAVQNRACDTSSKRKEHELVKDDHKSKKGKATGSFPNFPPKQSYKPCFENFTLLKTDVAIVLIEMQREGNDILRYPRRPNGKNYNKDISKHCHFYRDFRHTTEICRALKEEIKNLIQRRYLKHYIKDRRNNGKEETCEELKKRKYVVEKIFVIIGGPPIENISEETIHHVNSIILPSKKPKLEDLLISFGAKDFEGVSHPHNDAIVVDLYVKNFELCSILVDNRSSVNVLFWDTFVKIKLDPTRLQLSDYTLVRFTWAGTYSMGAIELEVTTRSRLQRKTIITIFQVIRMESTHNALA